MSKDWGWTGSSHGKVPVKYLNALTAKHNTIAELTKPTIATVVITLIFSAHLYCLLIIPHSAAPLVETSFSVQFSWFGVDKSTT